MKKTLILSLLSFFGCKTEPICTVNKNSAGKQIYNLEEAACFIALELDKDKSDLKFIRRALIAEENYMKKIGLISNSPNLEDEFELDINQMIEYVLKKENVCLSKDELLEIYDTEIEYLKFIGVATY
jgi:hypothetical protein